MKLDKIFKITDVDYDQVVIEVDANDPLTVAMFPFVNTEMAYITVTRGKDHTLTIIKKDGKTTSFDFGESGYTLVNDSMKRLKENVIKFLAGHNIFIDYDGGNIKKAKIYYNSNFSLWQLTFETDRRSLFIRPTAEDNVNTINEAIEYFKSIVEADAWDEGRAPTGIEVWTARKITKLNVL